MLFAVLLHDMHSSKQNQPLDTAAHPSLSPRIWAPEIHGPKHKSFLCVVFRHTSLQKTAAIITS